MADRAQDRFWIAESSDMLEKLRHDRQRLHEGITNLRNDPREAHYAAYDFFVTAWATAYEWIDDFSLSNNGLFTLAQQVANGVKHPRRADPNGTDEDPPSEETREEADFSSADFNHEDFHTPDLELYVTEREAREAKEGARTRGLDPKGIVQDHATQDRKKISVLVLADRLIESLEQKIQEGST